MHKNYGGVIWTNHALRRLQEREIKQGDAWATWKRPEKSRYDKSKGIWIYHSIYRNEQIEVVAKKNDKGEWVILSVWSKPSSAWFKKVSIGKKPKGFMHKILQKFFFS